MQSTSCYSRIYYLDARLQALQTIHVRTIDDEASQVSNATASFICGMSSECTQFVPVVLGNAASTPMFGLAFTAKVDFG